MRDTLYLDINVFIDAAYARPPDPISAAKLLSLAERNLVRLAASSLTFPFAYYVLTTHGKVSSADASAMLQYMAGVIDTVSVDGVTLSAAFASPIDDLEDAVQYACADACGARLIFTRDASGFVGLPIPSIDPKVWLAT